MNQSKALAPVRQTLMSFDEKQRFANAACKSQVALIKGRTREQAIAEGIIKIQYGEEVGLGPMSALMGLYVVDGKVTWSATLCATKIKTSGRYDYKVISRAVDGCELEFFEGGASMGKISFVEADAKRAGLLGKNNWKNYPAAMYFARALTAGARTFCPDVFHGAVYTPEEVHAGHDGDRAPETIDVEVAKHPDVIEEEWEPPASADPDLRPGSYAQLKAKAEEVAAEGSEAWQTWWGEAPDEVHQMLQPIFAHLNQKAAEADWKDDPAAKELIPAEETPPKQVFQDEV